MSKIVRNKLFEDPDESYAKDNFPLRWDDNLAHPFGVNINMGKLMVGPPRSDHSTMNNLTAYAFEDYEGRIWPQAGVIAFWEAPPKKILMHILELLLLDDEISVYNLTMEDFNDFLFDIPNPDQSADDEDAIYTLDEYPENPKITIKDQGFEVKIKRPQHTISPLKKKKEDQPKGGYGSEKYAKEKPLAWRQAMYTSESLVPESLDEAMVGDVAIQDVESYIGGMAKGVKDKIDFISKINPDCILDFGCADGYILNNIHQQYPKIKGLIGYDLDEKMINRIKSKYPDIIATDNWKEAVFYAGEYDSVALSLMSVIHEVYTYSDNHTISKFWKQQVFNPEFEYVVIRDMMPKKEYLKIEPDKSDVHKIKKKIWSERKYRKSFEKQWGKLSSNIWNMYHWLLKYDYKSNWSREVKENYFPVSIETVKSKIPSGWKIIYEDHYIFPPIAEKVKRDFGIEIKHPTHVKMIIQNENRKK